MNESSYYEDAVRPIESLDFNAKTEFFQLPILQG